MQANRSNAHHRLLTFTLLCALLIAVLILPTAFTLAQETAAATEEAPATQESTVTEEVIATEEASATTEASATDEITVTEEAGAAEAANGSDAGAAVESARSEASSGEATGDQTEEPADLGLLMLVIGVLTVGGVGVIMIGRDRAALDDVV